MKNNKPTLCWDCQRALPKEIDGITCSWAKSLEPVAGWMAEKTTIGRKNQQCDSYIVYSCPLFIADST